MGLFHAPGDPVCRGCGSSLFTQDVFCDLGYQPMANALLTYKQLDQPEIRYPTRALVCRRCLLVQLPHTPPPGDLFPGGYPFYSGSSAGWLVHCKRYADMIVERLKLGPTSRVIEIGSNDGTMLRRFRRLGIPAVGIEPSALLAEHAQMEGLATIQAFWSDRFACELLDHHHADGGRADLVIANNVLAHVPDLTDFLDGVQTILAPGGTATFEVPYIANLIHDGTFDQVYAEHHSYFSIRSLTEALNRSGLRLDDIEIIETHGGSLRAFVQSGSQSDGSSTKLSVARDWEHEAGLHRSNIYLDFASRAPAIKRLATSMLANLKGRVVGYGASAKATTILNYLGVGTERIEFVADVTLAKQMKYLPGVRIPVGSEEALRSVQPDVVINFCWNWREESEARIHRLCPDAHVTYLTRGAA